MVCLQCGQYLSSRVNDRIDEQVEILALAAVIGDIDPDYQVSIQGCCRRCGNAAFLEAHYILLLMSFNCVSVTDATMNRKQTILSETGAER